MISLFLLLRRRERWCVPAANTQHSVEYGNVVRLGAFIAFTNRKLYLLTFTQSFKTAAVNGAEVSEYVGAGFALVEAKAFCFVERFNGSCGCFSRVSILINQKLGVHNICPVGVSILNGVAGSVAVTYEKRDEAEKQPS